MLFTKKYTLRILCTLGTLCLFSSYLKPMEGEGEHEQEEPTETSIGTGSQEGQQAPPEQETGTGDQSSSGTPVVTEPTDTGSSVTITSGGEEQQSASATPISTSSSEEEAALLEESKTIQDRINQNQEALNTLFGENPSTSQQALQRALGRILDQANQTLKNGSFEDIDTASAFANAADGYRQLLEAIENPDAPRRATLQQLFDFTYEDLQELASKELNSQQTREYVRLLLNNVLQEAQSQKVSLTPLKEELQSILPNVENLLSSAFEGNLTTQQTAEKSALTNLLETANQTLETNLDQTQALINSSGSYLTLLLTLSDESLGNLADPKNPNRALIEQSFNSAYARMLELTFSDGSLSAEAKADIQTLSDNLKSRAQSLNIALEPNIKATLSVTYYIDNLENQYKSLLDPNKNPLSEQDKQQALSEYNKALTIIDVYSIGNLSTEDIEDFSKSKAALEQLKNTVLGQHNDLVLLDQKEVKKSATIAGRLEDTIARNKAALMNELKTVLSSKQAAVQKSIDSILNTISSIRVKIGETLQQFWQQNIAAGSSILESIMGSLGSLKTTVDSVVNDSTIPDTIKETVTNLLYETASATLSAASVVKSGIDSVANPIVNTFYNQTTTYVNDARTSANKFVAKPQK